MCSFPRYRRCLISQLVMYGDNPLPEPALIYCHCCSLYHDDVIKWKHFPRHWPFVRGIHRSPVNSPHKGQWRGALIFSLICVWINDWVNNREAGDLRRYRGHYDVIVMTYTNCVRNWSTLTDLKSARWILMLWCFSISTHSAEGTLIMFPCVNGLMCTMYIHLVYMSRH